VLNVRADSAWRPVVGFEGIYEVSNFGSVRSVDRVVVCHDGVKYRRRGQVISQQVTPKGYRSVSLLGGKKFFVHRLVLEAFVGPRPEGCITLHADEGNGREPALGYVRRQQA
jgi:hypothetical protein